MNEGERVRWYVFALGSEDDFHTAHWHGERVLEDGRRRTDVVELLPATMKVADMVASNPGSWLYHCHVAEHMMEGMFTQFTIHPKAAKAVSTDPSVAFFGLTTAGQSLQIKRAELINGNELQLAGTVTVFDAFSIFNQTVALKIGGKTIAFQPDRSGLATAKGSTFRVRNVNPYGVIYGGSLEFEIVLKGDGWQGELKQLSGKTSLPVTLQLGEARHSATAARVVGKP